MLALVIALVGPLFVDWTSYRAAFEREATIALGQPVHVLGAADMQILPMPRLHFESVHVGPDEQNPILTVDAFDIGIELFPLVQGKIEVVDMTLKSPSLKLEVDEQGQFDWRQDGGKLWDLDMEKIRLNDVRIENGQIDFLDRSSGRSKRLTGLNGGLEARTLVGPYKIEAAFRMDGNPYSLMLSTGTASAEGMRVKSLLTPANFAVSLAMDGNIQEGADERLHYVGTTRITNAIEGLEGSVTPWTLSGDSDLTASSLVMPQFEFSHGPVDQAYRLNGAGTIDFGAKPRFDVVVSSRQLDFDRALGNGPNAPINLQDGIETLANSLAEMPLPGIPGHIGFDVPGVILGGGVIRNLQLDADLVGTAWKIDQLTADLPGQTIVSLSGLFSRQMDDNGKRNGFEGQARIRSDQPLAFSKWWLDDAPTSGQLTPFDLSGQVLVKSDHIQVSDLDLSMEGDRATGYIDWYAGTQGDESKGDALSINLDAERIDLDAVMGVGSLLLSNSSGSRAPLQDIALDIETNRLVSGSFEGNSLSAKLRLAKGSIEIDQLSVDDFAGATISARGLLQDVSGTPHGRIEGKISADDLEGFSALIERLVPDQPAAGWFARNQRAMSPADLSFSLSGGNAERGLSAKLDGTLGGGNASLKGTLDGALADWANGDLDLAVDMDNPDGRKLLSLMGLGDGLIDLPRLSASASLKGALADGAAFTGSLKADDGALTYDGDVQFTPDGRDGLKSEGQVAFETSDLAPYLMAAGVSLTNPGESLPVSLKAGLTLDDKALAVDALEGQWNDQPVSGALNLTHRVNNRLLKGAVELGDMDGIWLGETVLGAGRLTAIDRNWPDLAFIAPVTTGEDLPIKVDVSVKARSLELAAPYIFQQPSFSLVWQDSGLSVRDFRALLQGGEVSGGLDLDNVEGEALLKSHIRVENAALAPLVWQRDGRSVARGQLDVNLDVESQGRSMAGLVSGLSGTGTFTLKDATLNYLNPSAFAQVIRAVDAGMELNDEEIRNTFVSHMDAGSTEVSSVEGTFVIAGGALRANNIEADADILQSRGNLVVDLSNQTLDGDWSIKVEPDEEDAVTGAQPEVGLAFSGPMEAPERVVDVAPFTGYLTIRAFEREVDRVERLQADILEKDRMRRLLRLYRERAKHREEEQIAKEKEAMAAEQAAAEAEAKKADEAQAAKERAQAEAARQEAQRKAELEAKRKAADAAKRAEQKAREDAAAQQRARAEAERKAVAEREAARRTEESQRAKAEADLLESLRQKDPVPAPQSEKTTATPSFDINAGDIIMRPLDELTTQSVPSATPQAQPEEALPPANYIDLPQRLNTLPKDRIVPSLGQGRSFSFSDDDMATDYIIQNY
ncbi:AsmA family protein [Cohaesibacter marisflavi]|uniref:AsmA family protein n=1 Tax=Cohaesibacter marisflavi TaxID=655353 RepID=A0A1I5IZ89_9HYPH|nr:AsmA family protein [Cohaesibacter marisflavi]SFO65486.1 AsmA family protein [Cohaesibacter marisflavi]